MQHHRRHTGSDRELTMRDVARRAGVSASTVSRVVNDDRYVGAATKLRVERAIEELGFQPNRLAQRLRHGRATETVALVIEDVANPFYSAIAEGVDSVARANRHMLILGTTRRTAQEERHVLEELLRRRVDGFLIVPSSQQHLDLYDRIARSASMVFVDRRPPGIEADAVVLDNRGSARRAVEHLIGAGHRRIAYLGGASTVHPGKGRLAGYRRALAGAGLPADDRLVRLGNHDAAAARDAAVELLAADPAPTAVFADNNRMTVGLLNAIRRTGHRVAVAGFDDLELAELLSLPLTLVTYDPTALGRRAAELLFARINGAAGPPRRITVPTTMITHEA
jgi:LacI family transcriptional regulator, galactose operon repressor